jgi:hypothetical protein
VTTLQVEAERQHARNRVGRVAHGIAEHHHRLVRHRARQQLAYDRLPGAHDLLDAIEHHDFFEARSKRNAAASDDAGGIGEDDVHEQRLVAQHGGEQPIRRAAVQVDHARMPCQRRGHRIEPGQILIEVRAGGGRDRSRLFAKFLDMLDARQIRRPDRGKHKRHEERRRGRHDLTPDGLALEDAHGVRRILA